VPWYLDVSLAISACNSLFRLVFPPFAGGLWAVLDDPAGMFWLLLPPGRPVLIHLRTKDPCVTGI
jgi:hypothetical protein